MRPESIEKQEAKINPIIIFTSAAPARKLVTASNLSAVIYLLCCGFFIPDSTVMEA